MKSLTLRSFLIYAFVLSMTFLILSGSFVFRMVQYDRGQIQNEAASYCRRAADLSEAFFSLKKDIYVSPFAAEVYEKAFLKSLFELTEKGDATVLICDTAGNIMFVANQNGSYLSPERRLSDDIIQTLESGEEFSGRGSLEENGASCILSARRIFAMGEYSGIVLAAVPADRLGEFSRSVITTFTVWGLGILVLGIIVTFVISRRMSRPITDMTSIASEYARGDYSRRVAVPERDDEIRELTLAFNNMAEAIETHEKDRRDLVANVSHDLRTPMTTISGFVDGILDGTIKPENQEYYLKIISEEIKRLSRMANGILQVSRFEQPDVELNKIPFDLSEAVRRIVIGFQQRIEEKHIDLSVDMPDSLSVTADRDGMFQVIYNLFDNATKFVPAGGRVVVDMEKKGSKVYFSVTNTGPDIPESDLDHIFDQFYQGDRSRTGGKSGAGLGLYIVKTVVNRHGGDVGVQSGSGVTEFTFTIPLN